MTNATKPPGFPLWGGFGIVGAALVTVGGLLLLTARGFFATDNTCPHRGGPLAEGDLIGDEIICPWHLWGFDVRTGLCPGAADYTIATHEVKVDGDRILVRLAPVRETSGVL